MGGYLISFIFYQWIRRFLQPDTVNYRTRPIRNAISFHSESSVKLIVLSAHVGALSFISNYAIFICQHEPQWRVSAANVFNLQVINTVLFKLRVFTFSSQFTSTPHTTQTVHSSKTVAPYIATYSFHSTVRQTLRLCEMAPKQRMRIANEKASKNITQRGNVPKSTVSINV